MNISEQVFAIVDTETSGTDPRTDAIVECAFVRIRNGQLLDRGESLVNPGRPINPEATAVNGITDDMVAQAPSLSDALDSLADAVPVTDVVVAHNASFDKSFLPTLWAHNWICSYRLALLLWPAVANPTLANWKNKTLYNYLKLTPRFPLSDKKEHRAIADVLMTAELFLAELDRIQETMFNTVTDVESLLTFSFTPVMPFGRHRGPLDQVPADWLRWSLANTDIVRNDLELREQVIAEIQRQRSPAQATLL